MEKRATKKVGFMDIIDFWDNIGIYMPQEQKTLYGGDYMEGTLTMEEIEEMMRLVEADIPRLNAIKKKQQPRSQQQS